MPPSHRPARTPPWRRYLRFLGPNLDADIDDELSFHFAERVEALRAVALLLVIAVAASLAPTWRAVRVAPAGALRGEGREDEKTRRREDEG
ncbi:MAG: hypothetical protein IT359_14005 [Gemmatimonadaceae bacterium]|nr:hypothetical protein [Gemmatimonadaceae bacterium]